MKKKSTKTVVQKHVPVPQHFALGILSFLTFIGDAIRSIPNIMLSVCTQTGSFILSIPIKKHILKMNFLIRILHDIGQLVFSSGTQVVVFLKKQFQVLQNNVQVYLNYIETGGQQ